MSRFHNLDASIARAIENEAPQQGVKTNNSPATPDEPEGKPDPESQTEGTDMADEKPLAEREDYQAGHAAGTAAANDRMKAVFASEHFTGREAHAARLLGNAKLDASDIVAELPNFTKAEAPSALTEEQQREAAEESGRKEMQDAMKKAGNVDLGTEQTADDSKTGRKAASAVWDKANAAVGRVKKEG